ncbi:MAG: PHP domain-containing protein [Clostridiales bacterium]|nr:PHP domain-containing protein [Clostridiales bacterium]
MENIKFADLHNHTTASDGLYTPKQLVYHAHTKGLAAIGVTDHDTTYGLNEAEIAGKEYNIEIIPGIEINTQENNMEVHVLGYFIDYHLDWFQEALSRIRTARYDRARKIVDKLVNIYGMDLDFESVKEKAGGRDNVGRPHIARAMIDKGIVKDIPDAFEKYLGENCKAYVKRYKITVREGINLINKAGGVAVLAHPGLIGEDSIVERLVSYGFAGIEAYHSKHTTKQSRKYAKLSADKELIITGGSDCHGEGVPMVGDVVIDYETVNKLRESAKGLSRSFTY